MLDLTNSSNHTTDWMLCCIAVSSARIISPQPLIFVSYEISETIKCAYIFCQNIRYVASNPNISGVFVLNWNHLSLVFCICLFMDILVFWALTKNFLSSLVYRILGLYLQLASPNFPNYFCKPKTFFSLYALYVSFLSDIWSANNLFHSMDCLFRDFYLCF